MLVENTRAIAGATGRITIYVKLVGKNPLHLRFPMETEFTPVVMSTDAEN